MCGRYLAACAFGALVLARAAWAGDDGRAAVHGAVVEPETTRPLAGLAVTSGASRAVTDAQGRFTLAGVPPVYDITIADPGGASVSVYRGVHRRDPRLEHWPVPADSPPVHGAAIRGTLTGGPFPLTSGLVSLSFTAQHARGSDFFFPGPPLTSTTVPHKGPAYGPIVMRWDGPASIAGELAALRRLPDNPDAAASPRPASSWWFARQPLTLTSAETLTANLNLARVPSARVMVRVHETLEQPLERWRCDYRGTVPASSFIVAVDADERHGRIDPLAYALSVPDLRGEAGGSFCFTAETNGYSSAVACGLRPGDDVSVSLVAPPALSVSDSDAGAARRTISWRGGEPGIFEIMLEPRGPAHGQPRIRIYTSETSLAWPDVRVPGVNLAAGAAAYVFRVGTVGPFATVDDATGPNGLGTFLPRMRRLSVTSDIKLPR